MEELDPSLEVQVSTAPTSFLLAHPSLFQSFCLGGGLGWPWGSKSKDYNSGTLRRYPLRPSTEHGRDRGCSQGTT